MNDQNVFYSTDEFPQAILASWAPILENRANCPRSARIIAHHRPESPPTIIQNDCPRWARIRTQLMYAAILQEDEAEYRQLIASQLAPGMSGDDAEDRLLIPRETPYFVGDIPHWHRYAVTPLSNADPFGNPLLFPVNLIPSAFPDPVLWR